MSPAKFDRIEYHTPMLLAFVILVALMLVMYIADFNIDIFEDGSFVLRGCLPWAICALGG